jgi:hypothetical protein
MIPRHWKIVLSLLAIFGLGAVSGALFALRLARQQPARQPVEDQWVATTLAEYRERLGLTPGQVETIKPLFTHAGTELRQTRAETAAKIVAVLKELNGQVAAELTPEQKPRFEALLQEKRDQRARSGPHVPVPQPAQP